MIDNDTLTPDAPSLRDQFADAMKNETDTENLEKLAIELRKAGLEGLALRLEHRVRCLNYRDTT